MFERQNDKKGKIFHLLVHSPQGSQWVGVSQAQARSLGFCSHHPCRCQGHQDQGHHCPLTVFPGVLQARGAVSTQTATLLWIASLEWLLKPPCHTISVYFSSMFFSFSFFLYVHFFYSIFLLHIHSHPSSTFSYPCSPILYDCPSAVITTPTFCSGCVSWHCTNR